MPLLLSIVELGGYPNFMPEYQAAGFQVVTANSMRKAIGLLKRQKPDVVVAEFNFQSDFRDRTSNLESLLATLQTRCPGARLVVFYETRHAEHLDRLLSGHTVHAALPFPITPERLLDAIRGEDTRVSESP